MKNKVSMFVLLAEIVAIVVLHSARTGKAEADRQISTSQPTSNQITLSEERPSTFASIK